MLPARSILMGACGWLVLGSVSATPQTAPDIFSCVVPSRVATGTLTYQIDFKTIPSSRSTRTIERVNIGGADLIRVTVRNERTAATSELSAATLVPTRHESVIFEQNAGPAGRVILSLELRDGFVRGAYSLGTSTPIAVDSKGRTLAFGLALDVLLPAVDWEKCPQVQAHSVAPSGERLQNWRRAGNGTTSLFDGQDRAVFEIQTSAGTVGTRYWITQTAPYLILKRNSDEIPEPSVLISYIPGR